MNCFASFSSCSFTSTLDRDVGDRADFVGYRSCSITRPPSSGRISTSTAYRATRTVHRDATRVLERVAQQPVGALAPLSVPRSTSSPRRCGQPAARENSLMSIAPLPFSSSALSSSW